MFEKNISKKQEKNLRDGKECVMRVLDKSGWWCFYTGPKEAARYSRMLLQCLSGYEIFKRSLSAILILTSAYAIDILYKLIKQAKSELLIYHAIPINYIPSLLMTWLTFRHIR